MPPKEKSTEKKTPGKTKLKKKSGGKVRKRPRELRLKGWLKTPEDWARFDEWAKKNASPRKIPGPEPLPPTQSKPLWRLKKRMTILSKPRVHKAVVCVIPCVTVGALNAKASRRIRKLARPKIFLSDFGCSDDQKISKAALNRTTSETDEKLARPKIIKTEDQEVKKSRVDTELSQWIEFLAIPNYRVLKDQTSDRAMEMKKQFLDELEIRGKLAYKEWKRRAKERKKTNEKDDKLKKENDEESKTDESINTSISLKRKLEINFWRYENTKCKEYPPRINKSARTKELSEWIEFLAIPNYRVLNNQTTDRAMEMKEKFLVEMELRGKQAYKEWKMREKKRSRMDNEDGSDEAEEEEEIEGMNPPLSEGRKLETNRWRYDIVKCKEYPPRINISARSKELSAWIEFLAIPNYRVLKDQTTDRAMEMKEKFLVEMELRGKQAYKEWKIREKKRSRMDNEDGSDEAEEEEEIEGMNPPLSEGRKLDINCWRYDIAKCKEYPPRIKKSTLSHNASEALLMLAQPKYPCEPVTRTPPRERDEYGRYLVPKQETKKPPQPPPYKMRECKENEIIAKKEEITEKPIDRKIALAPTIDPLIDPYGAKIQAHERERLKGKEKFTEPKSQKDDEKSNITDEIYDEDDYLPYEE